MTFDAGRYRREVLDPGRAAGNRPPDDLRLRYQLPPRLSPAAVGEILAAVRAHWRRERATLAYRKVVEALEADDRRLQPIFEAACAGDLAPLEREIAHRRHRQAGREQELADELAELAEPLGLLTPAQVGEVVADGHDREQVDRVLRRLGVDVRAPDPIPAEAPGRGFRQLRSALTTLDCRHIADFLFDAATLTKGFTVFDGFTVAGQPSLRLDQGRVAEVARQWQSRLDGKTPAETVLTVLRGLTGPGQLRDLLLYECASDLRRRRDRQASTAALVTRAGALGLAGADARRLAFAVRTEPVRRGSLLAEQLAELFAQRAVMAAHRLVDGVPTDQVPEDARELAGQVSRLAARAAGLRDRAAASSDADAAWRMLEEAGQIASDLPGLAALRRRLPPARPGPPRPQVVGDEVVVSWPASPSRAGEIRYRLLRADRPFGPGGHGAVAATATPVAETAATEARDRAGPVNTALHYAVVAERDGVACEPVPAPAPVWRRPDVADLRVTAGERVVSAAWRAPAGAARVMVRRAEDRPPRDLTDGEPVPVTGGGFADQRVATGRTYHYLVVTVYIGPDGAERHSRGVRVSAAPVALPEPVAELRIDPLPAEPGWLRAAFPAPATGTVALRELDEPPRDPAGTRVATTALPGRAVPAVPVPGGLKLRAPPPPVWLLAVTVNGDLAAIGPHRQWRALPAPAGLRARPRAGGVLVTWQWPDGAGEVELRWRPDGPPGREGGWRAQTVSGARYRTAGGVTLALPAGSRYEITVAAMVHGGDGDQLTGPAATVAVALPATVTYTVARRGWRAGSRRVEVTLRCEQPVRIGRLVLVTAPGGMPLRPEDGEVLASAEDLAVSPATPAVLGAPAGGRSGHWLRCFAPGGAVELRDPPREQLRMP